MRLVSRGAGDYNVTAAGSTPASVHVHKAASYNLVNTLNGYPSLAICAPPEVIEYEAEEEL